MDSVKNLMDEIVIVDTGSTDRTKEIASRYTDKVFDFEWVDDFSAARNFSFEKATGDYIYVADADEVVDEENQERFRILKETILPEIDIVQMKYCNQLLFGTTYNFDREYRPKLFKRLRTFIWTEPVHEMVRLDPIIYDSEIEILHMPECNHASRDFSTFQKHLQKGLRLSKRLHHMYAMELFIAGQNEDFMKARPFFEASVNDAERSLDEIKEAACIIVKAARIEKDVPTILKMCLKDLMTEGSAEMCYELGEYFYECADYQEAVVWFYNAAYETPAILNIRYTKEFPLKRLAQCQRKLGNEEEALRYEQEIRLKEGN